MRMRMRIRYNFSSLLEAQSPNTLHMAEAHVDSKSLMINLQWDTSIHYQGQVCYRGCRIWKSGGMAGVYCCEVAREAKKVTILAG